jgi:hypothetical protein
VLCRAFFTIAEHAPRTKHTVPFSGTPAGDGATVGGVAEHAPVSSTAVTWCLSKSFGAGPRPGMPSDVSAGLPVVGPAMHPFWSPQVGHGSWRRFSALGSCTSWGGAPLSIGDLG